MQYIQRVLYKNLIKHLKQPEFSLILGPRQVGKTTLMMRLKEDLQKQKTLSCYFNLDIFEEKQYFNTQHHLINQIQQRIGKRGVVFIDEIQRLENAGLFLKGLYDLKTSYKFVVSGSGSLELKANIIEPMTGRKRIFYLMPLSFDEFIEYKTQAINKDNPSLKERLIKEYFNFGGYPRVVLSQKIEDKRIVLNEIYHSYLEKDIGLLLHVEKTESFYRLIQVLASQVGNLINQNELANTLGINQRTIDKYLYILEKTFIISLIRPFFTNARKELKKQPKVYFNDLGLLKIARSSLASHSDQISGGEFENACYLRLKELNLTDSIHYWRSTAGAEVDFVIRSPKTGDLIPIEAKINIGKKISLGKSLYSFINQYDTKRVFFYNLFQRRKNQIDKVSITSLSFDQLPNIS